ncbi:hypothetical protein, partial [Sedimentibacter sp.]
IEEMAKSYQVEEERMEAFKNSMLESSKGYIEETLKKRKVIEMLVASAVFTEPVKKEAEDSEVK